MNEITRGINRSRKRLENLKKGKISQAALDDLDKLEREDDGLNKTVTEVNRRFKEYAKRQGEG